MANFSSIVGSSSVGSYVLSGQDRANSSEIDPKIACARVLKFLGKMEGPQSVGALLSVTGFSEKVLGDAISLLSKDGLVRIDGDKLSLTDLGFKAQFIVGT